MRLRLSIKPVDHLLRHVFLVLFFFHHDFFLPTTLAQSSKITCWTETFSKLETANTGLAISNLIDETCKIEIAARKRQTKIYCKSLNNGEPYINRYNQHYILVIYTHSGFLSLTRLVRPDFKFDEVKTLLDQNIIATADIDINEFDYDFNKYKYEQIYFSIVEESFESVDDELNSEESQNVGVDGIFEYDPTHNLQLASSNGKFQKFGQNQQFNITFDFNHQRKICSGLVWFESFHQNLKKLDFLDRIVDGNGNLIDSEISVSNSTEIEDTKTHLRYLSDGFFLQTNSDFSTQKLLYKHPLASETHRDYNNSLFTELKFVDSACSAANQNDAFCNNLEIVDAQLIRLQTESDQYINSKTIHKLLVICQNYGFFSFDFAGTDTESLDLLKILQQDTGKLNRLVSNSQPAAGHNYKFLNLPEKDTFFTDKNIFPVRLAVDTTAKKLAIIEPFTDSDGKISDVSQIQFDLRDLSLMTDSPSDVILEAAYSPIDKLVVYAYKNGANDIIFAQYYLDLEDGVLKQNFPSAHFYKILNTGRCLKT